MAMSTAMYSFVHGVLIQPLPFRDQERLVVGWKTDARAELPLVELSYAEYADWRAQSTSFEELAAMPTTVYGYGYVLTGYGDPVQVESARVSGNFFRVLGAGARIGRTFTDRDEFVGAPPVVVISSHLWRQRFRSDPALVGSAIRLNGVACVVLGVMPDGFEFPRGADIWSPLGTNRQWVENRGAVFLQAVGRLKPGVSRLRAEGEIAAVAARVAAQHPEAGPAGQSAKLTPIAEYIAGNSRPALYLLLAAALFLLAMSAINVASLWLVHVSERQPETSVRAALGAGRGRIARQFLTEALVIAILAAVMGTVLAYFAVAAIQHVAPADIPRLDQVRINLPVLGFSALLSLLAAALFGTLPALAASRVELSDSVKDAGPRLSGSRRGRTLLQSLVVAETAVSVILLAGAGFLVRTLQNLEKVDLGFDAAHTMTMRIRAYGDAYQTHAQKVRFYDDLLASIRAQNGVVAAGAVLLRPLEGSIGWETPYVADNQSAIDARANPIANFEVVTPGYFRAVGTPLEAGRDFEEEDTAEHEPVAIVSQSMARQIFGSAQRAIGRRVNLDPKNPAARLLRVVGVVADVRYRGITAERFDIYLPYRQSGAPLSYLAVKTRGSPELAIPVVRNALRGVDSGQAVTSPLAMGELVDRALAGPRFALILLSAFALAALVLAAVGICGIVSHSIEQQKRDLSIRLALGASHGSLIRSAFGARMLQVLLGEFLGLGFVFSAFRMVSPFLYRVGPADAKVLFTDCAVLATVAAFASWLPARRLLQADPAALLREAR
jgi:putative ABC transport system permease protein